MKTKELIALLQRCDDEENVGFVMESGCCGDQEELEISYSQVYDCGGAYLKICFQALPGYQSCRESEATKAKHRSDELDPTK